MLSRKALECCRAGRILPLECGELREKIAVGIEQQIRGELLDGKGSLTLCWRRNRQRSRHSRVQFTVKADGIEE